MTASSPRDPDAARARLAVVLRTLTPVLDIVREPVDTPEPPDWCRRRGWEAFLLGLDDGSLAACERGDWLALSARTDAPADLRELSQQATQAACLPLVRAKPLTLPEASLRGVSTRKREQLSELLGVLAPMAAHAERILDIGSGSGHFSRLAAELFQRETRGVDRDPSGTERGRARAVRRARDVGGLDLEFSTADVLLEAPPLQKRDLAVGLHACGELGDELVMLAANAGCDLALISCCLQKIRGRARASLSDSARGFTLPRAALGLANLTPQADGVETSLDEALRARATRYALRNLLRARGLEVAAGEEMRGVNRRRAHHGLGALANHVLARQSLPAATQSEILRFEQQGARDYAAIRRLSLPRNLLARLVELSAVLDRGALLEERGQAVLVAVAFDRRVTPRNVALFASNEQARLPEVLVSARAAHAG